MHSKTKNHLFLFIISTITLLTSCNKINNSDTKSTTTVEKDVYVVGYDGNIAKLWKNDIATNLTDGSKEAKANYIYLSGNDVYIGMFEFDGASGYNYKLLKNGSPVNITGPGNNKVYAVFVTGSDIYACGYSVIGGNMIAATLWKNGQSFFLPQTNNTCYSMAYSIYINGSDVYVGGGEWSSSNTVGNIQLAKLWKNGIGVNLPLPDYPNKPFKSSPAIGSIFVSNNDVYCGGSYTLSDNTGIANIYPLFWKNGVANIFLPNTTTIGSNGSIIGFGNDIYMQYAKGYGTGFSGYGWMKNWSKIDFLPNYLNVQINSVLQDANDFYLVGYESNGSKTVAKYWKGNVVKILTNGQQNAQAQAIFIN